MSFFERDVRVVSLVDWLDWAGGLRNDIFVALPMIQRGSVWKPNQIIELWDSLLQGMPIGSLMISDLKPKTPVRRPGQKNSEEVPDGGGLGLIDGQQRTLAVLTAWPLAINLDRRIWVDFADKPAPGQLLRLRVTTANQPFGFRRDDPSKKLSLDEKRKAHEKYSKGLHDIVDGTDKSSAPSFQNSWPYSPELSLPIDLRWLIETRRNSDPLSWSTLVMKKMVELRSLIEQCQSVANNKDVIIEWPNDEIIKQRINDLQQGLTRVFSMELPLIRVDNRFFELIDNQDSDPPLALLFKRVGTGGTKLSDADYVYSIIKHIHPKTYDLVESLYDPELDTRTVARLLTSTDLVLSAVRLAVADWSGMENKYPDRESPSKQDFHKLLRNTGFLEKQFMPLIEPKKEAKQSDIVRLFEQVQQYLEYDHDTNKNGLPRHMFPYIGRPLVQVLLRIAQIGYLDGELDGDRRDDLLRLVLFWIVNVRDARKASELSYKTIKINKDCTFLDNKKLGKLIHDELILNNVAIALVSPLVIEQRKWLVESPNGTTKLRGESRFNPVGDDEIKFKYVYDFYRHWWQPWTYHHPILLWLQREHVNSIEGDPMAGKEDDTPYDYDHILPYYHWGDWRGTNVTGHPDRLPNFSENEIWVVGNGIGNVRVWGSSKNRSDGDVSPEYKLRLIPDVNNLTEDQQLPPQDLLRWSAIPDIVEHKSAWRDCSRDDAKKRSWDEKRTIAFQKAVELRAFHLYKRYFTELNYSVWYDENGPQCGRPKE